MRKICTSQNQNQQFGAMKQSSQIASLNEDIFNLIISTPNPPLTIQANTLKMQMMSWDTEKVHSNQYHYLYNDRLKRLTKRVTCKLTREVNSVSELEGKLGYINLVGMLKRLQCNRKRAFEKQYNQYYQNKTAIYDEKDGLELEDLSGRIMLEFENGKVKFGNKQIIPTDLPHGVVIGVYGKHSDSKNVFMVKQIILPQLPPQQPLNLPQEQSDKQILIISQPTIQQIQRMFQYILSNTYNCLRLKSQIKSVVIMGCSDQLNAVTLRNLDQLCLEAQQSIDIFFLPNGNTIFPAKAYHPIMFKKSYEKIGLCSNPQTFKTENNLEILFFGGQNVRDMAKNCSYGQTSLETLEVLMQYTHMSPCSPFSLKTEMTSKDQLIMQSLPHVVIAGQCERFMTKKFQKEGKEVILVTLAERKPILLNLDNLRAQEIDINESI